jgi:NitT/TauT family transport system substrate-binding protein
MTGLARALAALFVVALAAGASAPARAQETAAVRIAQQFGIAYLPFLVVREQRLIERFTREQGLREPRVEWVQVSGAAAMNDGLVSGTLDFVSAGVGPMIIVWSRTRANLRVRGVVALGSMPNYLLTTNPAVRTLADFTERDRIALPSAGVGFQAVVLQMAAEQAFGPGQHRRLDPLVVSMAHPDGLAALLSARSEVTAHFTSPPYSNIERQDPRVRQVLSSFDVLGGPHTFNVVYAAGTFRDANPRTMRATVQAFDAAMTWINASPRAAAELYKRVEGGNLSVEQIEAIITAPDTRFTIEPERAMAFADFEFRAGVIRDRPANWQELFFPEIHDRTGS